MEIWKVKEAEIGYIVEDRNEEIPNWVEIMSVERSCLGKKMSRNCGFGLDRNSGKESWRYGK